MFNVICLETNELERDETGTVLTFPDGRTASTHARELSAAQGKRYQPRPVLDDKWREREQARLDNGTYQRLPWDDGYPEGSPASPDYAWDVPSEWHCFNINGDLHPERIWLSGHYCYAPLRGFFKSWFYAHMTDETRYHYAHVSTKIPGNIAFTTNAEKGAADIQTSMKPGRYLKQFYGHALTDARIRELAQEFLCLYAGVKLKFATTADDIERVYVNGPNSCMAHDAEQFHGPMHPARVYAAGDLAVAYLTSGEGDDEHITARALCWPAKKLFGRWYGDDKISTLLEAEGYSCNDRFHQGARMLRIGYNDHFVAPYIDHIYRASDRGDYLIIDRSGELECDQTHGLSAPTGSLCENCGERVDADNIYYVNDAPWCECCADTLAFYCEYSETRYDIRDYDCVGVYTNARGSHCETWERHYADRHAWRCDQTGDYYSDGVEGIELENGDTVCPSWFKDHGSTCRHCGEHFASAKPSCDCEETDGDETADADNPLDAPSPRPDPIQTASYRVGDRVYVGERNSSYAVPGVYDISALFSDGVVHGNIAWYGCGLSQTFHVSDIERLIARGPVTADETVAA